MKQTFITPAFLVEHILTLKLAYEQFIPFVKTMECTFEEWENEVPQSLNPLYALTIMSDPERHAFLADNPDYVSGDAIEMLSGSSWAALLVEYPTKCVFAVMAESVWAKMSREDWDFLLEHRPEFSTMYELHYKAIS